MKLRMLPLVGLLLAMVLSGCGAEGGASTTSSALATTSTTGPVTTPTTPPDDVGLAVYFFLGPVDGSRDASLVPVYRALSADGDPIGAAMEALLVGPTDDELAGIPAITSAIPAGTTVLSVEVAGTLARVDLSAEFDDGGGSASMFARLAQVVYTATRVDGVDRVEFLIEGQTVEVFSSEGIELDGPQSRADYYDQLPAVFVDEPAWGEPVVSPLVVRGLSNVFEAVSQVMLTDDDGLPLFEGTVMATCGTGCWGEWEIEIPFAVDREQFGALIVWVFSAQDGSRVDVREYAIRLR
ncbi:MAG TPA: GerMN domain-containing protein [Acidimicrobiia bacterium]|nr:GerMN domain-containing protein [Acidimicrobiia bacterium]